MFKFGTGSIEAAVSDGGNQTVYLINWLIIQRN